MEAYKYITKVDNRGHFNIPDLPFFKSKDIEVIILPFKNDDFNDFTSVSESSTRFWLNNEDAVWDNV